MTVKAPGLALEDTGMAHDIERRVAGGSVEYRKRDDGVHELAGYAAVFNQETVIGSWFREVIVPGAFRDVLGGDTRLLFNHDANFPIARTTNGTLRLREDERGLWYEATLNPDDPDAMRVAAKVARGDVSQSSFAFWIDPEGEEWDESEVKQGKLPLRKLTKFAQLDDVSPVTYPAYTGTSVSARAEERAREIPEELARAVADADAQQRTAQLRLDVRRRRQRIAEVE